MDNALFPSSDVLDSLVGFCGQYVAVGVGLAFVGWVLGYVIYFIVDALRY